MIVALTVFRPEVVCAVPLIARVVCLVFLHLVFPALMKGASELSS